MNGVGVFRWAWVAVGLVLPLQAHATSADNSLAPDATWSAETWPEIRGATFDLVWDTVHTAYFNPTFGGIDWDALHTTFGRRVDEAPDNEALRPLLQAMLDALGRSHFAIVAREAAVFAPEERNRIGTVGVTIVGTQTAVLVATVQPDSPAAVAGIVPGDAVVAVDGYESEAARAYVAATSWSDARKASYVADLVMSRLQSSVGSVVHLTLRRRDGAVAEVSLTTEGNAGTWSEPIGNFPSLPVECETRFHEPGIAYLRLSSFTPALMARVRPFLRSLAAADGLVIDLRGNHGGIGGMASGIAGLLVTEEFTLGTMRMRRGLVHFEVYPQERAFIGPVAVLIDHASASTSEILAAGLQEAGRARLFGETSAGAALPSSFKVLPTGDLFQFAIADVQTPKNQRIEGVGVQPDEPVARTQEDLAAGQDPVLDHAVVWLKTAAVKSGGPGSGASVIEPTGLSSLHP